MQPRHLPHRSMDALVKPEHDKVRGCRLGRNLSIVMPGLDPGIQSRRRRTRRPGLPGQARQ